LASFQRQMVKIAKVTTLISVAWTILCAVLLVGWQITLWLQKGVWNSYSFATLTKELEHDQGAAYVVASADRSGADLTSTQAAIEWLLEIPVIVPLLTATALLLGFYVWLNDFEKRSAN
jgi:hypothetical protein